MKIHAISTGKVKITQNWQVAREGDPLRLAHTLFDRRFTDWLPIFCYVIEHPEGLIVIDTGIPIPIHMIDQATICQPTAG